MTVLSIFIYILAIVIAIIYLFYDNKTLGRLCVLLSFIIGLTLLISKLLSPTNFTGSNEDKLSTLRADTTNSYTDNSKNINSSSVVNNFNSSSVVNNFNNSTSINYEQISTENTDNQIQRNYTNIAVAETESKEISERIFLKSNYKDYMTLELDLQKHNFTLGFVPKLERKNNGDFRFNGGLVTLMSQTDTFLLSNYILKPRSKQGNSYQYVYSQVLENMKKEIIKNPQPLVNLINEHL